MSTCIELALKDAGIDKEQVNYINAHATRYVSGVCRSWAQQSRMPVCFWSGEWWQGLGVSFAAPTWTADSRQAGIQTAVTVPAVL